MVPSGHLSHSQVDPGAEAAGVQGAAGRALRPRLPPPPPPWSPPCLHEGGLVGAWQGVGDLPRPVIRRLAEPQRAENTQTVNLKKPLDLVWTIFVNSYAQEAKNMQENSIFI